MIGLHIGRRSFDETGCSPPSTVAHLSAGIRQAKQAANIVRVAAKTASPIVSSVPKCRRSKASRAHPMDTVNGDSGSSRSLLSVQLRPGATSGIVHRSMPSAGQQQAKPSGTRISKHQQQMPPLEADQVLLIVNDDHIKGGGVPIIGRRLPSKSALAMRASGAVAAVPSHPQYHQHPSTDCLIASVDGSQQVEAPASAVANAAAPVIGRRSHRMIQQKQQQQQQQQVGTIYQYDCHDYPPPKQASDVELTSANSNNRANRLAAHYKQQPLSIIETHHHQHPYEVNSPLVDASPALMKSRDSSKHRYPNYQASTGSLMNPVLVNEYYLPPMEKGSSRRVHGGAGTNSSPLQVQAALSQSQRYQLENNPATSSQRQHRNGQHDSIPSSACSPLCSISASLRQSRSSNASYLDDHYETPCCSSPSCNPGGNVTADMIEPPCCRPYVDQNCLETCCGNLPIKSPSASSKSFAALPPLNCHKSHSHDYNNHHHHHHNHRQPQQTGDGVPSGRSHRQATRSSHHHSSCQANESPQQRLPNKPSAAYRSSSCHDSRRANSQQQQQQQQHQHQPSLLMSRRNVLPVHPKPVINYRVSPPQATASDYLARNSITGGSFQSNCSGPDDPAAVTQMYESLAAELKAKLGDPKLRPILLPPKDYDTMSRNQGKLTGIELRRSTNPQLVGPAANRLATLDGKAAPSGCCATNGSISEEQQQVGGGGGGEQKTTDIGTQAIGKSTSSAGCGSSRSSGRSSGHNERASPRSRSNSSSGLGSISIEARSPEHSSPSSSKLSSSEDMRQASCQLRLTEDAGNFTRVNIIQSAHRSVGADIEERCSNNNNNHGQPTKLRGEPQVERKNPSPNSSDSGHSGSARLDSGLSNEEQKLMLPGSGDQFYNPSLDSTLSPSIGSSAHNKSMRDNNNEAECSQLRRIAGRDVGRGAGIHNHNPSRVSSGVLWNGRVEVPLKVNSAKNGNTYLATKQIIY